MNHWKYELLAWHLDCVPDFSNSVAWWDTERTCFRNIFDSAYALSFLDTFGRGTDWAKQMRARLVQEAPLETATTQEGPSGVTWRSTLFLVGSWGGRVLWEGHVRTAGQLPHWPQALLCCPRAPGPALLPPRPPSRRGHPPSTAAGRARLPLPLPLRHSNSPSLSQFPIINKRSLSQGQFNLLESWVCWPESCHSL